MKKVYKKPFIEIELYETNTAIAAGCVSIINLGPGGVEGYNTCSDFEDPWSSPSISLYSLNQWDETCSGGTPGEYRSFYEEACDCKYTASGEGYFTS